MTTRALNPDLCQADQDLLLAMTAEHNASVVVIEMLRARVEGMVAAAGLLSEEGTTGRDMLKRFVEVTRNLMSASDAHRDFKRVADAADEINTEFVKAWRAHLEAMHMAKMDLLGLCFVDDSARKPRVATRVP